MLVVLLAWLISIEELRKVHLIAAALATFGGLMIDPTSTTVPTWVVTSRGLVGALAGAASLLTLRMASSKMTALEVLLSLTVGQLFLSLCFFSSDWSFPTTSSLWSVAVVLSPTFWKCASCEKFQREHSHRRHHNRTDICDLDGHSGSCSRTADSAGNNGGRLRLILAAALLSGWRRGRG